jgi:hypothetical protein
MLLNDIHGPPGDPAPTDGFPTGPVPLKISFISLWCSPHLRACVKFSCELPPETPFLDATKQCLESVNSPKLVRDSYFFDSKTLKPVLSKMIVAENLEVFIGPFQVVFSDQGLRDFFFRCGFKTTTHVRLSASARATM